MTAKSLASEDPGGVEEPASGGGFLGVIERVGNKVPHPVMMFLFLIIGVIVLSTVLAFFNVAVTETIVVPDNPVVVPDYYEDSTQPILEAAPGYEDDFHLEERTISVQPLLSVEGIRFIFTSFVPNFTGFAVVGIAFIALMGAGVAERAGLMSSLIKLLVAASPRRALALVLIFVGVLSSVATDAGYLILVPLGAAAFASVGRHPLAGMAACFAGVGAIFGVNIIPGPVDAQVVAITNEALTLTDQAPQTIVSNYFFSVVSSIVLAITAAIVTERIVERRLGKWEPAQIGPASGISIEDDADAVEDRTAERRGLKFASIATLVWAVIIILLTALPGAPLRDPVTGDIIGNTPFMDSLMFIITMAFLVAGIGFGYGSGTFKNSGDVIDAVVKTFAGLAGLVFMLLMIAQFIAVFNYSQMPAVIATMLSQALEASPIGTLPLLLGMIVVILGLDIIMPGLVPKWAIFAPIFVPLFDGQGVPAQTLLAAYRVGDSPMNVVTPLMVYLPFMVTIAQRYQKNAGIGTVIALMIPYVAVITIVWVILFSLWFILGLPLGPGYPITF
ncbi:MAG TPA: AbgT family transporter [Candidatus Limnocylindrales bacterium]|nr:AbgT family transporter [Candidatus Limnocylindrales bacterium]